MENASFWPVRRSMGLLRRLSYASTLIVIRIGTRVECWLCRLQIKTYPLSLDDFNELCTAVIVKKITGTPNVCILLISSVLQLGSKDSFFFNLFLLASILKKGILGTFEYLASTFYLFVKKRVLCASFYVENYSINNVMYQ